MNLINSIFPFAIRTCCLITLTLASTYSAASADRPNILFAISDDQSFAHTSINGYKAISTPAFDRVAREGVLFTQAFSPSPGCSPTRAALLSGRHIWQIEHAGTHGSFFDSKYISWQEALASAGYFTGYTGKGWSPGDYKEMGRTNNPAGPVFAKHKKTPPYKGMKDNDYAANFNDFLAQRPKGQPFSFWFGASEPHRGFEKGSGLKAGKKLKDVVVPPFLPDTPEIRSDIADYLVEIEWFDTHLNRMIRKLEEIGELDNTIIIVTSDNGMAFPRAKANMYEYGFHMPLAIRWGAQVPANRTVTDILQFVDITATIYDATNTPHPDNNLPLTGRSFLDTLTSTKQGRVDKGRKWIVAGRERHSSSRFGTLGYPQRVIRTDRYLYIRNFKPNLWPAGAPQKYLPTSKPTWEKRADTSHNYKLEDMHLAYQDIDACPSLTFLVDNRNDPYVSYFFHLAVDKRPAVELFDIQNDPGCLYNLADDPNYKHARDSLGAQLDKELTRTGDPRMGPNGDIFETYKRVSSMRLFPPNIPSQRVAPK